MEPGKDVVNQCEVAGWCRQGDILRPRRREHVGAVFVVMWWGDRGVGCSGPDEYVRRDGVGKTCEGIEVLGEKFGRCWVGEGV